MNARVWKTVLLSLLWGGSLAFFPGCKLTPKVGYLMSGNPTKDDPQSIHRGQALFVKNCAECHGMSARGGLDFPDVIPDLIDYASENSDQDIAYRIASGKLFHMPDFDSYLDEQGIWDVTNYLKALAAEVEKNQKHPKNQES